MKNSELQSNPTHYSEATEAEREKFRDWLRGLLKSEVVDLTFTKKDGTIRKMKCTLSEEKLPPQGETKARKENIESLPVFDLEKNEWRAFRYDSITEIKFTLGV